MKYYLAIQSNKVLVHATAWVIFVNMLSERSKTQESTFCVIPFTQNVQNRQIQRQKDLWLPGIGGRADELITNVYRLSLWGDGCTI